jgi:DNA-3-methyladenine glycosylase I
VADDRRLFEKLCLEGFQSGLSWLTILRKRDHFRRAFAQFDIEAVAGFGDEDVERLLADPGIVRNRAKVLAAIGNARRCLDLVAEVGSLAAHVWGFEPAAASGRPPIIDYAAVVTASTSPAATALSRDLKRRGWSFVGPTTAYAFMQAVGIVDDHVEGCAVRPEVEAERSAFRRPG